MQMLETVKNAWKVAELRKKILFTHEGLMLPGEFKVSRKKIAARVSSDSIKIFDPRKISEHLTELSEGIETEVAECFAQAFADVCTGSRQESLIDRKR